MKNHFLFLYLYDNMAKIQIEYKGGISLQYIITFLEGIISFVSPCMLPMIPLYISYFSGNTGEKKTAFLRSIAFVFGFTLVFCLMGIFAGTIGNLLREYQTIVNVVCGVIVILFGLSYLEIIRIPFLKGMSKFFEVKNLFSAFLFGIVFSINRTPCTGAFLGSALMMASTSKTAVEGMFLLFTYSIGFGLPLILSAILIEKLNTTFTFIKKHYKMINRVCGIFLMIIGILMSLGIMNFVMYKFV